VAEFRRYDAWTCWSDVRQGLKDLDLPRRARTLLQVSNTTLVRHQPAPEPRRYQVVEVLARGMGVCDEDLLAAGLVYGLRLKWNRLGPVGTIVQSAVWPELAPDEMFRSSYLRTVQRLAASPPNSQMLVFAVWYTHAQDLPQPSADEASLALYRQTMELLDLTEAGQPDAVRKLYAGWRGHYASYDSCNPADQSRPEAVT
jgi:hypothetical protein